MTPRVMETTALEMEFKSKYLIVGILFCLLLAPTIYAFGELTDITDKDKEDLLKQPDLKDIDAKQVDVKDRLDESYIVEEKETIFKKLKQIDPVVYVHKKDKTTYHIDSKRDFIENESVTLKLFYDIQPDTIKHINHKKEFVRYYFPTQWNWTPKCSTEEDCSGGYVTFEVENIDKGFGSNTFPIGVSGPSWNTEGQDYGVFDGESSYAEIGLLNFESITSFSAWVNPISIGDGVILGDNTDDTFLWWLDSYSGGLRQGFASDSGKYGNINSIPLNKWTFITTVTNSTSVTFYINGELDRIQSGQGDLGLITNDDLHIGSDSESGKFFDGSIDEVLIYNRSLSQAEITELYNKYEVTDEGIKRIGTPNITGQVLNINFDNYSVADISGEENHGTNTNVSFGVVENTLVSLIEGVDYSIIGNVFSLIDLNYVYSLIDLDYTFDYTQRNQGYTSTVNIIAGLSGGTSWLSLILIVAFAAVVIGELTEGLGGMSGPKSAYEY